MSREANDIALSILLVSTSYPRDMRDWQGRFIADMVQALAAENSLHLWAPLGELPSNVHYCVSAQDSAWLTKLTNAGGIAHLLRHRRITGVISALGLLRRLYFAYRQRPLVDVAHVNWLQNALPLWGTKIPALITILGSDFALLKLPGMVTTLRKMMNQRRCILAPNAAWMAPVLRQHFGDIAEVRAIPFGVEKKWFALQRTKTSQTVQKWLVITRLTKNKLGDLLEWGRDCFGHGRELHLFGPMQEELVLPDWLHYHGPTNPDELQQKWFPHASGLITLSRHDEGRPQIILEAMASGLPVIASDLPAHKDLIRHLETGWIATSRVDLRAALDFLSDVDNNSRMGLAAKTWVSSEVGTWDDCAARYKKAYADLMHQ